LSPVPVWKYRITSCTKLVTEYGGELEKFSLKSHKQNQKGAFPCGCCYINPEQPHQLTMMPGIDLEVTNESRRGRIICNQATAGTIYPAKKKPPILQFPIRRPETDERKELQRALGECTRCRASMKLA